jgi:hypothetical protein
LTTEFIFLFSVVQKIKIQNIQVHPKDGLKETLNQMQYLEMLSLHNQDFIKFVFQNFYSSCLACIPAKIWNYMKNNFIYTIDEYDETLTAPYILIETKKGDCDDFALFAKTCLDILGGFYTNYLLLGRSKNEFTHIVCFAHRGRYFMNYNDPVIIDGANDLFNYVSNEYKFRKIVQ